MNSTQITAANSIPSWFKAEKWDKIIYLGRTGHDLLLHCILKFDKRIDEKRLSKAFRLSLDSEPILGCRFVPKGVQPYWERRNDLDKKGIINISKVDNTMLAVVDYMAKPIDPCKGPQIQAQLFRTATDTLCLKVNHMVADAGGVKEYVELLSFIYRQIGKDSKYIAPVNLTGSRSRMQVIQGFNFWKRIKIVRQSFRDWSEAHFPAGNLAIPMKSTSPTQKTYVVRTIGPHQFQVIKKHCRKYGVTINDIMIAAFFRSLDKLIQPSPSIPLRLVTTVDLRRYLPTKKGEAICNLSGKFEINIGSTLGNNLAETVFLVHNKMKERKNDCFGLGDCHHFIFNTKLIPFSWACQLTQLWGNFIQKISPKPPPPVFTNLGKIEKNQFNFGEVIIKHAFLTALVTFPPLFLMSISGFEETLTISIGFCEDALQKKEMVCFLQNILEEIQSLIL